MPPLHAPSCWMPVDPRLELAVLPLSMLGATLGFTLDVIGEVIGLTTAQSGPENSIKCHISNARLAGADVKSIERNRP